MKILAIMGSPRKGKNNDALLDSILQGILEGDQEASITRLNACDLGISPCIACDACSRTLGCVQRDGMIDLIPLFNEADIIIMTSPMYFNSISAQLKAIIDRNQMIWSSKYALGQSMIKKDKKRVGYMICTAGAPDHPFGLNGVIPIMDLFFKSINTEYYGNYFVNNVDEKPVYDNQELLSTAIKKGRELIERFKEYNESL